MINSQCPSNTFEAGAPTSSDLHNLPTGREKEGHWRGGALEDGEYQLGSFGRPGMTLLRLRF